MSVRKTYNFLGAVNCTVLYSLSLLSIEIEFNVFFLRKDEIGGTKTVF